MLTDSLERVRALSCDESFIVQAPAGSGKTELLTQRFLTLLTKVDSPEQIVALTFTKKAAFEMRSRIIQAIEKAKSSTSEHVLAKEVLKLSQLKEWHLVENPHRLKIYTIDSFCSQLAKSLPLTSGMGGMPDIEDNPKYLYKKAVENYIHSIEQKGEWVEGLCLILQHFHNRYEVVEKLLIAMLERRDQWLQLVLSGRRNPSIIKTIVQNSLLSIHEEIYKNLNRLLSDELKQEWINLASFAASQLHLEKKQHELNACLNIIDFPKNTKDNQDVFAGLLSLVFTSTQTIRKRIDKNTGFPPTVPEMKKGFAKFISTVEQNETLVELLKIIPDLPSIELDADEWTLLEALWEGLPILVAHLQLLFNQYNKVDFTEVSLKALEALGEEDNPTDLALILDYQLKHLLVDEFQDTSSIQYQLFAKIVSAWQPFDGRTLFVVGDPMQSIYRFRGAEVGLYLRLQQQGFGHIQPINLTLTSNFRSDKTIVDWVNTSFCHIFSKENDMVLGKIAYSPSVGTKELNPNGVYCYELNSAIDEAEFITQEIQKIKLTDPKATIAILVRARAHAQIIFEVFKTHDVAYQAIDMLALSHSPIISDLLMLTRVIMLKEDRLAWLSLFRSPVCGLTLTELWQLTQGKEDFILPLDFDLSGLNEDAQARINKIMTILSYWLDNAYRLPLCQSVQHLWMSLGFDRYYQDSANAASYFDLLQKWEKGNQFGDFEALQESLHSLYQSTHAQATDFQVQIMTIHKSKGLEFDHVFIPGLHHSTTKEDQPLVIYHEIPYADHVDWLIAPKYTALKRSRLYDYIHTQLQQKATYETQRLLYVAATRAKKQLIWSYFKGAEKSIVPKGSFLSKLLPFLSPISLTLDSKKESKAESDIIKEVEANTITPLPLHCRIQNPNLLPWEKVDEKFISTSEISEENPLNRPLMKTYEKLSIIGSYLHRLFAEWQSGVSLTPQAHGHCLIRMGLHKADLPYALELISTVIRQCQHDPQFDWIMDPAHVYIRNEFPLNFKKNNKLQTRILDKFFIDKNDSAAWIIDFKLSLDAPNPSDHALQLKEYARLINRLGILDGKPLRFGLYYPYQAYWWEQESISA